MGDLIVMSRSKPSPGRTFSAGHSAEIAFFTGVRYYRMDEAVEPTSLGQTVAGHATPGQITLAQVKRGKAALVGAKLAIAKRRRAGEPRVASRRRREALA